MRSDWLESFAVFSDELNFTRAAALLNISQPALHVKIKQLSLQFPEPLYSRHGKQLTLTSTGQRVAAFAREQTERRNEFLASIQERDATDAIILAAGEGSFSYLLATGIRQFLSAKAQPLRLLTGNKQDIIDAVATGRAHLGVAPADALKDGLVQTPLCEAGQVLLCKPEHRLAGRKSICLADLEGEALVVPPGGRPHRLLIERLLASAGTQWSVAVEVDSWHLMQQFVEMGVGVSLVNDYCHTDPNILALPIVDFPKLPFSVFQQEGRNRKPIEALKSRLLTTVPHGF